jgi:hypothetical protein
MQYTRQRHVLVHRPDSQGWFMGPVLGRVHEPDFVPILSFIGNTT